MVRMSCSAGCLLTLSASSTAITCNGGTSTISATANGVTGAVNFQLNGGAQQSSGTFANITAGTYTVIASDASGDQSAFYSE
jgi:hypothetical protein